MLTAALWVVVCALLTSLTVLIVLLCAATIRELRGRR